MTYSECFLGKYKLTNRVSFSKKNNRVLLIVLSIPFIQVKILEKINLFLLKIILFLMLLGLTSASLLLKQFLIYLQVTSKLLNKRFLCVILFSYV